MAIIKGAWNREIELRLATTALMENRIKLWLVLTIIRRPITLIKTLA